MAEASAPATAAGGSSFAASGTPPVALPPPTSSWSWTYPGHSSAGSSGTRYTANAPPPAVNANARPSGDSSSLATPPAPPPAALSPPFRGVSPVHNSDSTDLSKRTAYTHTVSFDALAKRTAGARFAPRPRGEPAVAVSATSPDSPKAAAPSSAAAAANDDTVGDTGMTAKASAAAREGSRYRTSRAVIGPGWTSARTTTVREGRWITTSCPTALPQNMCRPSLEVAQDVTAPRSSYTADGKCTLVPSRSSSVASLSLSACTARSKAVSMTPLTSLSSIRNGCGNRHTAEVGSGTTCASTRPIFTILGAFRPRCQGARAWRGGVQPGMEPGLETEQEEVRGQAVGGRRGLSPSC
mmetsp:Transcript_23924/g.59312  ORF Transcript_23924/g.59312 Transcript_23924/m.59312 type:complete len:354 (-) Transcript_23924:76-1137(-)